MKTIVGIQAPITMSATDKLMLGKELSRAQAALERAFRMAAESGELDLAKRLRYQGKAIGIEITDINGGPVRVHLSELLR
jgi:hypothetical protein